MNNCTNRRYCGTLREENIGEKVTVYGWVGRNRNLGSLIFTDMRDRTGIVQCVFDEAVDADLARRAEEMRMEWVVAIEGTVRMRSSINPNIPTGKIEILAENLTVFTKAETPPFEVNDNINTNEMLRLKYRYLDLRRPSLQRIMEIRHKAAQVTRNYFTEQGFWEIETPMLTKSTPEGARDYLVPSRVHPGSFYALPQSPQQYKQMLMLSGVDRYMQIARCFRDEDLRADRQPEFTQIDLEMSFVDMEDIMAIQEGFIKKIFKELRGVDVETPILRLTYAEAMSRFGSDKPDMRFGFELRDISDLVKDSGFTPFVSAIENGGSVHAINFNEVGGKMSRKEIDSLGEYVKTYRAKGLAWAKVTKDGVTSSFAKNMPAEVMTAIYERMNIQEGDLLAIIAHEDTETAQTALGALRCEVARRQNLISTDDFKFLWVTDFPLLEKGEDDDGKERFYAKHHPFTAPRDEDIPLFETAPEKMMAKAYDIVCNGYEMGGGSIRIHNPEVQQKMFNCLGFTTEDTLARFGHMIEAFKFGAPPHGGIAYGFDRIVMLLAGTEDIRDSIAFPKIQTASEVMTSCPSEVEEKQLRELCIKVDLPVKEEKAE